MKRTFFFTVLLAVLMSACSPSVTTTRIMNGSVQDSITILTEDGNVWNYPECPYQPGTLLHITFDTQGTPDVTDDDIIRLASAD